MLMKRFVASLALLAIFSGCTLFKYTSVEYNNFIVNEVNDTSTFIEESVNLYKDTIPDEATEKDEIDTREMSKSYNQAAKSMEEVESLLTLQSRNKEQQSVAQTAVQTYISAGTAYLESYGRMLEYYGSGNYQEDVTQVQAYDEDLHTHYTTFVEANNDLVDALESFVELE